MSHRGFSEFLFPGEKEGNFITHKMYLCLCLVGTPFSARNEKKIHFNFSSLSSLESKTTKRWKMTIYFGLKVRKSSGKNKKPENIKMFNGTKRDKEFLIKSGLLLCHFRFSNQLKTC